MLKKIIERYKEREFLKSVATILSGSTIAQLIPILIAPILSRIYTPTEFGILAVYLSVVQILGSVSTGRYEFALVIPEEKKDANNLFLLALFIVTLISFSSLIVILLLKGQLIEWFNIEKISRWLFLIPISTFLLGVYNLLNYYNTRLKNYKTIAGSTIIKSTSRSFTQLGAGLFKIGATGLVSGEIAAMFFGNLSLAKKVKNDINFNDVSINNMKQIGKKYKRFPLFSMWAVFFNSLSQNVSNFFISSLFSVKQTGYYSYAFKYITLPINLIGNAIGQVLMKEGSVARNERGEAKKEYLAVLKKLLIIGIPSFIILYFIVEDLFSWYFGSEWRIAGSYAKILMPYLFTRFIVFPLSVLNLAFEKQLLSLYVNLFMFIISIGAFIFTKYYALSMIDFLKLYNFCMSSFYALLAVIIFFVASGKFNSRYF